MKLLPVCVRVFPCFLVLMLLGTRFELVQADDAGLKIISPQPWQVVQRVGFDPARRENEPENSAALGFAEIAV